MEMALGFNTEMTNNTGDILPIIKYDTKAGDFIRQDRSQDANGVWNSDQIEMQYPIKMVMDFDNLEVGWLSFESGRPDFRMVQVGSPMPERPAGDFKNAFRVKVANKELGLREFSHSAKTVVNEMDKLHNQFVAERVNNPGKVPVVEIAGTNPIVIKTPQGDLRFKAPDWKIVNWIDKPDNMMASPSEFVAPAPTPAEQSEEDLF
jgi:hypothetical protein